jgi:predicted dehydrogenase
MPKIIRWGVLGAANIALKKVIPAMQKGSLTEVTAIASRNLTKAREAAGQLAIPKAYGSYKELLEDPDIDAIYNPLPNHLHVPWSVKAAEAGKHVLCEKPIAMSAVEAQTLIRARDAAGVLVGEAFMVKTHPQWLRAREIVQSGELGELRAISSVFSYFNRDPANVRNVPAYGGGGLMDVGCYPITMSRFIFGREPLRVSGLVSSDPEFGIDYLASAILDFGSGEAVFSCSMQMVPYQTFQVFGTKGRVHIEIPFNAPPDRPCRIFVDNGKDLFGGGMRTEEFPVCDQYTIQGDAFSRSILDGTPVPVSLEDAVQNMAVIEAVFKAGRSGKWEMPTSEGK